MILLIFNSFILVSSVEATNIDSAKIFSGGLCQSLLKYKGIVVKVHYAQYEKDGKTYPAYCLDKNKPGIEDDFSYTVSANEAIKDVGLWRVITNGYPYKSIEQLGCKSKDEAFTATKQAVYCYIHGNNPNDYSAIGEAGTRTLNALHKIVNDASNSNATQISNIVKIIKEDSEFKIDKLQPEYISKTYSIKADANIKKYVIKLSREKVELPEGIKITDINNKEKNNFEQNEKFKIMIPIKQMSENNTFKINVETEIESKPVLYGKSGDTSYQDYALTAETYEDASGNEKDTYYKNETKLKIIKQDMETKERLSDVEFEILNEKKQCIYKTLKTDEKGEIYIKNLLPGTYYIRETNSKSGYILNDKLTEVNIKFNQEMTVEINNLKEDIEEPQEPEEGYIKEVPVKKTVIKKLPVTGM